MTDRSDVLDATFARLRVLLDPYRDGLAVTTDRPDRLELSGARELTVTSGRTGRTVRERDACFAGLTRLLREGHRPFRRMKLI